MMPRVLGPMPASMRSGSMLNVAGSTSTKTGINRFWRMTLLVATNDVAGQRISSPSCQRCFSFSAATAICRELVPLLVRTQCSES